jgi:hypothetical protein
MQLYLLVLALGGVEYVDAEVHAGGRILLRLERAELLLCSCG